MFVLDTNVISELRRSRKKADSNVLAWASAADPHLFYVSPVTLLELETGVLRLERHDLRQGKLLRAWLNDILYEYRNRVLPIDAIAASYCAKLIVPNPRPDRDAWIAATAFVHGMTIVTRNVKDFDSTGVRVLNPWESQAV